ncbi:hypothetical protein PIB30_081097 [Stylosanthes scabra]|uniref:Uncharacterized protein n=1 Tax=Stylosanthes scabra TaxID=79078 RepID=A0ABU6VQ36_9FABA|nr:hypothetical protein [Stylosanthes scabra]
MAPKSRKINASAAPSSSQRPNTPPEPTYDATRFKSLAHERHFEEMVQFRMPIPEVPFSLKKNEFKHIKDEITRRGWYLLCNPPQKKMGIMLLRESYANARMTRRDKQSNPHYMTFVRGKDIDFSPESIKHSLIPSCNNSEVTLERAVLDHSIIEGLDIKAELLITENISATTESKDQAKRLLFPSIIYRLLYANGIKKIDGDKLILIERPITIESMTKNKYLEIQQEIQQQFPQHPPQDQQPPQVQQEKTNMIRLSLNNSTGKSLINNFKRWELTKVTSIKIFKSNKSNFLKTLATNKSYTNKNSKI